MGIGKIVAPSGSDRRRHIQNLARPIFRSIDKVERRVMAGDPAMRPRPKRAGAQRSLAAEGKKLKGSWANHDPSDLQDYLVSGYQNPRINPQSILERHFFIQRLFGADRFKELMHAELEFSVEMNHEIHQRAMELGIPVGHFLNRDKREAVHDVCKIIADREDTFERKWSDALSSCHSTRKLKVLELACGSANDYRFFDRYGLARFLDYTGVDLNDANIANARRMFPGIDFQVQDILRLPFQDATFDYVLANDIFEHLSLDAMERATHEATRVAREGLVLIYFSMTDAPDHEVRRRGTYHWNRLSASKVEKLLEGEFSTVDLFPIEPYLREHFGAEHFYNRRAWTLTAERGGA